jgi:metal-sulfur cluster biosynthetic enzyme
MMDSSDTLLVKVEFNPTVPHCSLATLIGLCIRAKLLKNIVEPFKLDIKIKEGAHNTELESKLLCDLPCVLLNFAVFH